MSSHAWIARRAAVVLAGAALVAGAVLAGAATPGSPRPSLADSSWGGIAPQNEASTVSAAPMAVNDSSWGG